MIVLKAMTDDKKSNEICQWLKKGNSNQEKQREKEKIDQHLEKCT